jgi:hypothetical protein
MRKVNIKEFGLRCVSNFPQPRPYSESIVVEFISAALREFSSYGIAAPNFKKNEGDRLFSYLISFSLFNGNVAVELNAFGVIAFFSAGQTERDADIIMEVLSKVHRCIPESEKLVHTVVAFCHAEFADGKGCESFFKALPFQGNAKPVSFGVVSDEHAEAMVPANKRLRLDIVPSEQINDGVFMSWLFSVAGILTADHTKAMLPKMKVLAAGIGIDV